jgi:hypothetical protein
MRTHTLGPIIPHLLKKNPYHSTLRHILQFPNLSAKIATPSNKQKSSTNIKRQSPYNIRPPKNPSITPAEIPIAPAASSLYPQNKPPYL